MAAKTTTRSRKKEFEKAIDGAVAELHKPSPDEQATGKKVRRASDQYLYDAIFETILNQRLLPGTKLLEDELADIFAVSRSVVRRALLRLSHDRIVDIQPNRGASVAAPDQKRAAEVFAARRLIELEIVRDFMRSATSAQFDLLEKLVVEEQNEATLFCQGNDIRLSGNFHIAIAEMSGNSTLCKFVKELVPQTSLVIAQFEKPGKSACIHTEHSELINVMRAGDLSQALSIMERHLTGIENRLAFDDANRTQNLRAVFAPLLPPTVGQ